MSRFPLVPMGDVLRRVERKIPVVDAGQYDMIGVRSFSAGCFDAGTKDSSETKYRYLLAVKTNDFVYPKLMAWEGAFAIVPPELDGRHVSPEFCTFEVKTPKADLGYIRQLFRWPRTWANIAGESSGTNVRRRRLYPDTLLRKNIPLPTVDEQRMIAARLDRVHNCREAAAVSATQARRTVQAVRDIIFGRIESRVHLRDVLEQSDNPVSVDPDETYKTAGLLNRGRGMFAREPQLGASTKYRTYNKIRVGQVIYSKLFGWEGSVAVVPPEFDGYHVSSEFPTFNIKTDKVTPAYLSHLTRWAGLHDVMATSTTGLGQRRQRVQVGQFLALKIPVPADISEQRRVVSLLDQAHEVLQRVEDRETLFDALMNSALNHAFNGMA